MNKSAMYIFANQGLRMSPGKLAAQVAHAAVRALYESGSQDRETWLARGETKIVLLATDSDHLRNIQEFLRKKGYNSYLVIDEGRTEIAPHSATALGVQILDRDNEQVQRDFADFRTYKALPPDVKRRWYDPGNRLKAA